ncbi:MAG: hypothetical protein WBG42_00290 [Cryomorphaceae bacterium]
MPSLLLFLSSIRPINPERQSKSDVDAADRLRRLIGSRFFLDHSFPSAEAKAAVPISLLALSAVELVGKLF